MEKDIWNKKIKKDIEKIMQVKRLWSKLVIVNMPDFIFFLLDKLHWTIRENK